MKLQELITEENSLIGKNVQGKMMTSMEYTMWPTWFDCSNMMLTSLKGAPYAVDGFFTCNKNRLTSLLYGPVKVDGNFKCQDNRLITLAGAPKEVGGSFNCNNNNLTSLEGAPKEIGGDFECSNCFLTSLNSAPSIVNGDFYCDSNKITSLKDIHKQITTINGNFYCGDNPITSHVIGILLINGLRLVLSDKKWVVILNKYIGKGRAGLIDCQNELIDAGLEEYAQL